jgi:hypothetical protein
MHFYQRRLWGAVLVAFCLMWTGPAWGAEFTATMISKVGDQEIPGKVYVKGLKVRNEVQAMGQSGIHITRPDKKLTYIILPQQQAYAEMPITGDLQKNMMTLTDKDKAKMKKIGEETISGFVCDKYETTLSHQGRPLNFQIWIARDLGAPVKVISEDGTFGMEYKDIKQEQVADSLFEPPSGFRKVKMPFALPPSK